MLFNSIDFAIFLPVIFLIYWFVVKNNIKVQNAFLLFASYVFYGWWDWRFLSLIIFSSFVDYFVGIGLSKTDNIKRRRLLLLTSIFANLGFLGFFKYFNFFTDNFVQAFTLFGTSFDPVRLNIILPVGISFYTFQTLSYSIDVYRKKLEPTRNVIAFFAFVSFFPQLVAGPIERATNLLPQFYKERQFDYAKAVDGMRQILWGLFKKMVIADNCAYHANQIFNNYTDHSGSTLLLGAVFFTFQIYGDFSGYSDIAIGTARLFGFNLMKNFAFPYFSRDIAEFWRRWHISLSTWFRDYVYIPLGGNSGGVGMKVRNIFIIFIVSGFWHGANWTFIMWGFLNAIYFLPLLLLKRNRRNLNIIAENTVFPSLKEFFGMIITFTITIIAWIFFRSLSISDAFEYIRLMFSFDLFYFPRYSSTAILKVFSLIFILLSFEWLNRNREHGLDISHLTRKANYLILGSVFLLVFFFKAFEGSDFIYFQF